MGVREALVNYAPRKEQWAIHEALSRKRFVLVTAHRRMGKTLAGINHMIRAAVENKKKNPRYCLISPTFSQSKRIAFDYLVEYTRPLKASVNIQELRVDFWDKRISLYGADSSNASNLRGQYFDGVILDEVASISPKVWTDIVRPSLADRAPESWALFTGTPAGNNSFKTLRDDALKNPDWEVLEFKASQTGILDEKELAAARRDMGEDKYAQEFECSFDAAVTGSYYGELLNEMDDQMLEIPVDPMAKTFVSWDLGMSDSTSLWVMQVVNRELRFVDFYENHGKGLDEYVRWLRENNYHLAENLLPHDAQVRELGTGKSRLEMLSQAGLNCRVVPRVSVEDGIQTVRRHLGRCWFNVPQVTEGLNYLRQYRREFDEKHSVFKARPLHDFSSHAADSFRYMMVGLDETGSDWSKSLTVNTRWIV